MLDNIEKELYKELSSNARLQIDKLEQLDVYTSKHIHSVPQIVGNICREMNYNEEQTKFFIQCAYLHDIGKIFIPSEILQKNGKLTDEEFAIIKTHTTKGAELCESIPKLSKYSKAVCYHHENNDGSGYPKGITNIPIEAEIVKVADIYDALVNKRQYKEKIEITQALEILKTNLIDRNLANKEVFIALLDVVLDNEQLKSEEKLAIMKMKVEIM